MLSTETSKLGKKFLGPALTHHEFMQIKRFQGFDGLRAIAALEVINYHFNQDSVKLGGWLALYLFFPLSGFLITTLLLREENKNKERSVFAFNDGAAAEPTINIKNFYIRRIFRILPVYIVTLALSYAIWGLRGELATEMVDVFPRDFMFLNEFAPRKSFGQSWTLGVEEKFYLFWPLLGFILIKKGHILRKRFTLALVLMGCFILILPWTWGNIAVPGWPSAYFSILSGCLLALVMHSAKSYAWIYPLTQPAVSCAIAVGYGFFQWESEGLTTILDQGIEPETQGYIFTPFFSTIVGLLLIIATIGPGPVRDVMSFKPLEFIGQRSYSLYMVQFIAALLIVSAVPNLHGSLRAGACIITALAMADVFYRYIEVPCINYGKKVSKMLNTKSEKNPSLPL